MTYNYNYWQVNMDSNPESYGRLRLCVWLVAFGTIITCYQWTAQEYFALPDSNNDVIQQLFPAEQTGFVRKGEDSPVKILLWHSPEGNPERKKVERLKTIVKMMNRRDKSSCEATCHFSVSDSTQRATEADVVAFHSYTKGYTLSELPSEKREDQIWVLYGREPPGNMHWKDPLENVMNWTMHYRSDSDIVAPYGRSARRRTSLKTVPLFAGNKTLKEWARGKSKLAVGVISNCHTASNRELLVKKLNDTGIGTVTVMGNCGTHPATCGPNDADCSKFWRELASQYSFFLAFENSLCEDYITDNFWRSLRIGMVPVVHGAGDYVRDAPPGSFIDAKDFTSAKELMSYMKMLADKPHEYQTFFEWRKYYRIEVSTMNYWCDLCKAADHHKKSGGFERKIYPNMKWWWSHNSMTGALICKQRPANFFQLYY